MPLLRIDAHGPEPRTAEGAPHGPALAAHLATLRQGAPLVVFTHGLRHSPFGTGWNPHAGLLSPAPDPRRHWKARSFVRQAHMGAGQRFDGHGIAFGWDAQGWIWPAMARARVAGMALARLMTNVRQARPDLRLAVVTHSLGARVVTEAMLRAPVPVFDRALLLTPADQRGRAVQALRAPGGRACTVVATQTRENWLCTLGFAAATGWRPTLARGPRHARWVDFTLDRHEGVTVGTWAHRTCHWSCYLRSGLWPLYRGWLTGTAQATMFAAPAADLQTRGCGPTLAQTI